MAVLDAQTDPADLGFDPGRLARIERHFARYVDDGRLAGWHVLVARGGRVAFEATAGLRDLEAGLPVEPDTLWRIYSMTKPITSVAAMTLWEEGAFELKDPVSRFLPAFADARVFTGGTDLKPVTVPLLEPVRMWHLLTHTAGLTYGFHHAHPVDALYRARGFEWHTPPGLDLAACCDAWAQLPLLFQPGAEWNYSVATDVLGRVLEVLCDAPLDEVLAERVLDPLGMRDTRFAVADGQADRLAALYSPDPATGRATRNDALGAHALRAPDALSGGGGLLSTAADVHRFAQMLLPGGADLERVGRPLFAETTFDGVGFGLGFSVVLDPVANRVIGSPGELAWGGAASTAFWVDPVEDLSAVLLTQLLPSSTWPLRSQLRQLVYAALVD
jgi:CubicO group peptidase (beta-lactamase class C family)